MGSRTTGVAYGATALALLCISGAAFYVSRYAPATQQIPSSDPDTTASDRFSIVTEPQDGMVPVEAMIESASSSIDVVMYEFDDAQIEQLLAERAKEGIAVRVVLDDGYFGAGSALNEEAFDYLRTNGVSVRWAPLYFALTHEKSMVVDGSQALIMTFNFTPHYYASDRDIGVVDHDPADIAAMERTFESDWNGQQIEAQNGENLVWSPNSRSQLLALINGAQASLDVYNEEMQDPQIISALAAAAARGVNVEVDMTYSSEWQSAFQSLSSAGVHVRTYPANAPLYIHAKVIIADDSRAFVGSENFSSASLDQNRELGIIVSDPVAVASLSGTFAQDWHGATPFLVQ